MDSVVTVEVGADNKNGMELRMELSRQRVELAVIAKSCVFVDVFVALALF